MKLKPDWVLSTCKIALIALGGETEMKFIHLFSHLVLWKNVCRNQQQQKEEDKWGAGPQNVSESFQPLRVLECKTWKLRSVQDFE